MGRVLVPLLALLVGAGLASAVLQTVTPGQDTTATAAAVDLGAGGPAGRTSGPAEVRPADYVGRPLAAVQAQLEGLGLVVQAEEVETTETDPGLVVDVAPLADGTTVVVSYAVAPETEAAPSSSAPRKPSTQVVQRPAETTDAPRSPAPAPTPSPTAPATPSATPTPSSSAPAEETTAPPTETAPEETTPTTPAPTGGGTEPTTPTGGPAGPSAGPTTSPAPAPGNQGADESGKKDKKDKGEITAQG